jgi:adenylate cyclase
VMPRLHAAVTRVHAHHLSAAGRRYAVWGSPPSEESTVEVCVGFADLVGYTEMGNRLGAAEVDAVLRAFEARAHDAATGTGRRLVKLIGDEAMFVAGTAADAVSIATALLDDPALGPMRVGIGSGQVVVRAGDVFGPPVNLAARLVAVAAAGEILVDGATAGALGGGGAAVAVGPRNLPGFSEPVEVYRVSRSGG